MAELKERAMCDDMMDELEVMVPGHRKRLTVAGTQFNTYINKIYRSCFLEVQACNGKYTARDLFTLINSSQPI